MLLELFKIGVGIIVIYLGYLSIVLIGYTSEKAFPNIFNAGEWRFLNGLLAIFVITILSLLGWIAFWFIYETGNWVLNLLIN